MGLARDIIGYFFAGRDRTATYDPGYASLDWYLQQDRPPFSLYQIDLMRLDHQVRFGTIVGNGLMAKCRHEVTSPSSEIKQFVEKQFRRIWDRHQRQIMRTREYGFQALQNIWKISDDQLIEFDTFRDFTARDSVPRRLHGKRIGFSVRNINGSRENLSERPGKLHIHAPQSCWLVNREEYNRSYGNSDYREAFAPWYEKAQRQGAYDLRRLRMMKDAWIGDVLWYPMGEKIMLPGGQEVSWRDMVREFGENRMTGAVGMLPSNQYANGEPKVRYERPTGIEGQDQIAGWIEDLDWDILDALGLPREVVEAAETGSGFSGRSIPFVGYLSTLDITTGEYTVQIDHQSVKPAVLANFGPKALKEYEVEALPLLDTVGEMMGDMGQPDASEGGSSPPQQQPGQQWAGRMPQISQYSSAEDPPGPEHIEARAMTAARTVGAEAIATIQEAFKKKRLTST